MPFFLLFFFPFTTPQKTNKQNQNQPNKPSQMFKDLNLIFFKKLAEIQA